MRAGLLTLNLLLLLLLCLQQAEAQKLASISGNVLDTKQAPVPGAIIVLLETLQATQTDAAGSFTLNGVRPGRYSIQVSMLGYSRITRTITINDTATVYLNFALEDTPYGLQEIEITSDAQRLSVKENAVLNTQVDATYLERNTGAALMNTLEKLPGVSAINMGVGIAKPVIRGLSFNRVLVTDSGIKQEGQQWGSDHGLEIDQFAVDQVEIVKGSASLQHGSDALGGVVRISHPVALQQGVHQGTMKTIYRSNNDTYGVSTAAAGNHNGLIYRLRTTWLSYADYKVPAETFTYNRFTLPIYDNRLKNTAGREKHVSAMIGVNKSWGYSHVTVSNFNQQVGIFSGAMGIPRAYQLTLDGKPRNIDLPSQNINHFKIIANSSILLGKDWLELDIAYQHNHRQELSLPHAHGADAAITSRTAVQLDLHTSSANLRYHLQPLGLLKTIAGVQAQAQENRRAGFEFLIPDYNSRQLGVYLLNSYTMHSKFILSGGLRVDNGQIKAALTREPFYYENRYIDSVELSPYFKKTFYGLSGAFGFAYNPSEQLSFKFNFGKTFRIPAAPELTANGMHHGTFRFEKGDAHLSPEQGYQLDLALSYERSRLQCSVTPFLNLFQNYIYLSPSGLFPTVDVDGELYPVAEAGQLYRFKQSSAIHMGAEATATYVILPRLILDASLEYVQAKNRETQLPLPFTPPLTAQASISYNNFNWGYLKEGYVTLNYGRYAAQNRVERNELATPGYGSLDLSTGASFGAKKRLKVTLQVQNVLNSKFYNHLSRYRILNLPEPARNINATLGVLLHKSSPAQS